MAFLVVAPGLLAVLLFVYVFIAYTFYVSLSAWRGFKPNLSIKEPLGSVYLELFGSARFQADLRNIVIFVVLFMVAALLFGLLLAILIRESPFAKRFFRTTFLLPYALSFIVTGVVWRWLFNPESGVNLLFEIFGVNGVLAAAGIGPLRPGWLTDPTVVLQVNGILESVFPPFGDIQVKLGIPLALIPVVIAAAWQLTGFSMAVYLAGLSSIQPDLYEAAAVDGAGRWYTYRRVIIPLLVPATVTIVVILAHTAMAIFDLTFAMSGVGPDFATDVPGLFVYQMAFIANRFNLAAAAAVVMFIVIAGVTVPYLWRTYGQHHD
ncbi:MAG: sugar ABC transporter permease [Chloroflexi bacterium]|jgi:glucose/mannose transport system permease protein|nr:sugar ABC transporter permease [Chloroflexota bacterium]